MPTLVAFASEGSYSPDMRFLIKRLEAREALHDYLRVPSLVNDRPNRVLPLLADERDFHDPERNPALRDCSVARWLAYEQESPVGRIMAIIHKAYNQSHGERSARFYQLDCRCDVELVGLLLAQAEHWAREQGMTRIIGPFGLSDKDPQGLQIEGFEHTPVVATPSNPAWLPPMVESFGYGKLADALAYQLVIPEQLPLAYSRIAERVLGRGGLRLLRFRRKSDLRPWVMPVLRLVNETYGHLLGNVPMGEEEMRKLAAQYMPLLNPAFVQVVVDASNQPVAFVVAMPDMSEGLRKAEGRLFPFGWWHVLRSMRTTSQLDLFLGAVRPDHQGRGLTAVLAIALMEEARTRGLRWIDSHLVLEENHRMRGELERLGGRAWKRYRVYQKAL